MEFERIASVYVINDKKQVLMLKHKKVGLWAPPGGHIEEGELVHQAAIRECQEETGIEIEFAYDYGEIPERFEQTKSVALKVEMLPKPIFVEYVYLVDHYHEHFVYTAKAKSNDIINNEKIEIGWFNIDQALELDSFDQIKGHLKYIKETSGLF